MRKADRKQANFNMEETCLTAADLSEPQTLAKTLVPFSPLKPRSIYQDLTVCERNKLKRSNPAFDLNPHIGIFALGVLISLLLVDTWADWRLQTILPEVPPVSQRQMQASACELTKEWIDYASVANGGQVLPQNSSASYHGSLLVSAMQESLGGLNQLSYLIDDDNSQAHCWAFAGQQGYATIQLGKPVFPTRFVLIHANVRPISAPQVLKRAKTLSHLQLRLHSSSPTRQVLICFLRHIQGDAAVLPLCTAVRINSAVKYRWKWCGWR